MFNSLKSVAAVVIAPVLLVAIFSTNVIKTSEASRAPALEKTEKVSRSLKSDVYKYLVSNNRM